MKKRPDFFNFMIIILLVIPVGLVTQVAWIYQHNPITELYLIGQKLSFMNYILIGTVITGIPLYKNGSRLLVFWLPVSFVFVIFNNWDVSKFGHHFNTWETSLSSCLFMSIGLITFRKKYLNLIFNPALKWWCCPKRKPIDQSIHIKTTDGRRLAAQIFDISKTGAFIKTHEVLGSRGQDLEVEIPTSSGPFNLKAKIIRLSIPQGHYPEGIGVQFSKLDLSSRLFLQKVTS